MRPTWLVLGLIVLIGTVAYIKLIGDADEDAAQSNANQEAAEPQGGLPTLQRTDGEQQGLPQPEDAEDAAAAAEAEAREKRAEELLAVIGRAHQAKDRPAYDQALGRLKGEAWDAYAARRFAVKLGWGTLKDARSKEGEARIRRLDQARRLLSRGVYLPEAFAKNGQPTKQREQLIAAIQKANVQVMNWGRRPNGGVADVTEPFEVPPGWSPVRIVSRKKLPYGHNVLLFWNHAGNLDPRRLRAGETLLLPQEPLSLHVHLAYRRLGLFLGDWFVKEFRVGVGRDDRPTPEGAFSVGPKMENPDWWGPNGHVPPLDPKNELGTAWIPFSSEVLPLAAGFGIHGTNRPQTVGTRCSNGCVRLLNSEASELFWWVRTGSAGGAATEVVIHPVSVR